MNEKYISLDNLKSYNKQMKETYVEPLEDRLAEAEGRVTIATFNITKANTTITLQNLEGVIKINWGDGTVNNELNHTYAVAGEYLCKIYDCVSIGDAALRVNSSLTNIVIGNGVISIGKQTFDHCTSLISVTIPNSVTSIANHAFNVCSSLTSVTFGENSQLTSIANHAFYDCSSLTEIVIPDGVTYIGADAFRGCKNLTSVSFLNPIPIRYNHLFSSSSSANIYVPVGCKQAYLNQWSGDAADENILNLIAVEFVKTDAGEDGYQEIIGDIAIKSPYDDDDSDAYISSEFISVNSSTGGAEIASEGYMSIYSAGLYATYNSNCIYTNGGQFNFPVKNSEEEYTFATTADITINITWAELKSLRDNGKLIPSCFYRITDYVCTTTQENTRAMNNQFDIIVQALSSNTLSEKAQASPKKTSFSIDEDTEGVLIDVGSVEYVYRLDVDSDSEQYAGVTENSKSDTFIAYAFKQNNEGVIVPVLYKTDLEDYGTEPDLGDTFYYEGEYELEGEVYDMWRKIEDHEDGSYNWDSTMKKYALTNKIVGEGLLIDVSGGDSSFNANVAAWELKYCLDNDIPRFSWADDNSSLMIYTDDEYWFKNTGTFEYDGITYYKWENPEFTYAEPNAECFLLSATSAPKEGDSLGYVAYLDGDIDEVVTDEYTVMQVNDGGKGVIYWMKDEYNNEAPYDFKNIIFTQDDCDYYTFNYGGTDHSLTGLVRDNVIAPCRNEDGALVLNHIMLCPEYETVIENVQINNNCSNIIINASGGDVRNVTFCSGINNKVVDILEEASAPIVYKPSGSTEIILD